MKVFFVDGSARCFADIIIENKITGKTCSVASYGFGVKQVSRIIAEFDQVLLIADTSHSRINKNSYASVMQMDKTLPFFNLTIGYCAPLAICKYRIKNTRMLNWVITFGSHHDLFYLIF